MRRLLTAVFSAVLIPSALVVLPVVSVPKPAAHPVAPTTYHLGVSLDVASGAGASVGGLVPAPALKGLAAASAPQYAVGPQQSTKPFRAVGLSWLHDPALTSLTAQVRVRTDGQWSDWQELDSTDEGTDGGTDGGNVPQRDGTDPLWVDHADGVQVHIEQIAGAAPSDLRVDLIDPGTSSADADPTGATTLAGAAVAHADTSQPTIITRAQWGADESIRLKACSGGPESAGALKVAFVHHTVTSNTYNPDDVPAIIRSIYAYHVQGEGWCDIGYNFLVDKYGRIFEGRYGGVQNAILGAHTGGFNTGSFGVAMIGEYDTVVPPKAMTDAMAKVPGVRKVFTSDEVANAATASDPLLRAAALSYVKGRSGDLILALKPGWMFSSAGTTHGSASADDQRVPLLLFGQAIKPGHYDGPASPADVAPTLAAVAGVPLPTKPPSWNRPASRSNKPPPPSDKPPMAPEAASAAPDAASPSPEAAPEAASAAGCITPSTKLSAPVCAPPNRLPRPPLPNSLGSCCKRLRPIGSIFIILARLPLGLSGPPNVIV